MDRLACTFILFIEDNLARGYHVDIARFAAEADPKWVDNILSRFVLPGIDSSHQGLARVISVEGIYHIALIRELTDDLGLSAARAVSLATELLSGSDPQLAVGRDLELFFARDAFQKRIDARIAEAVEAIQPAKRGRPPKERTD